MRRLLYISLVLVVGTLPLTLSALLPQGMLASGWSSGQSRNQNVERGRRKRQREEEFYRQRGTRNGQQVPQDIYDQALEQWRRVPRVVPSTGQPVKSPNLITPAAVTSLVGTVWTPIGPSPIAEGSSLANGRVSAIGINPNNPNVIYQGASGGGVWRTNNGGTTWTPLTDQQSSLGTGEPSAIAVDPSDTNTIYVGTSGRFVLNISKGILKSTDGGGSWIVLGSNFPASNTGNADDLFAGQSINVIIVDPANSNNLYLGASNGLFRSTDGGRNWMPGTNGGGDARSLVLDPTSPAANRRLYAGISFSGIRQSTDGGQTWTQILNNATPAVAAVLPANSGVGEIMLDLAPPTSPANPAGIQVLYVTMEGVCFVSGCGVADPIGVFRSVDQGATWNRQTSTGMPTGTQGGYDLAMNVDPASPGDGTNDIIYFGAVGAAKSTDSGNNFAPVGPGIHVDSHSNWVFARQPSPNPSIVLSGNDGGIWKSTDGGATWSGTGGPAPTINAGGLQTSLFYNLDVKKDATASVTEGTLQDNGAPRTTGSLQWTDTIGGDGFSIAFDSVNTSTAYVTSGFWSGCGGGIPCSVMFQSTDSGSSWINAGSCSGWFSFTIPQSEQDCVTAVPGTHPIKVDPTDSNYVYYGGVTDLWQTTNGMGSSFRQISAGFGRPNSVDIAPGNPNNVVAGFNGQVWVSTNAKAATVGPPSGVTFTNITRNLPNRNVTRVLFDPNDPAVIYVTLAGFGFGTPQNVFRTTIGGTTWTDISPPVNVPVNAIALDGTPAPTTIYIGNDLGVMRSVDGGASWTVLDDIHMPNVPVTDLAINPTAGVLRAATFGRGVFDLAAPNGPVISVNAENGLQFGTVCAGSTAHLTIQVFNTGTQDLLINSVQRIFGSTGFSVLPNPATPLIISPNSEVDFTVQFTPTVTSGSEAAQIRISSNDPAAPAFDLMATATVGTPAIDTLIADSGNFGDVCVGSFKDLSLTINNSGTCGLSVTNITSSSAQFLVAGTMSFPVVIAPGGNLQVPIRFQPTSLGAKSANITISSNDPAIPSKVVSVSGNAPPGDINVTGSTAFGDVCPAVQADRTISVCNTGPCDLHVTSATIDCPDFTIINNPFPATVSHDFCMPLTIRFTPTSVGPKMCHLTITSDDPDENPVVLTLTGATPLAQIDVNPDQGFLPEVIQSIGSCSSLLPFPILNKGTCPITITNVRVGPGADSADFGLSALPSLPINLQPGHTVGDGALETIFAPTVIDRDRLGFLSVTYVTDPFLMHTATEVRTLCGEGVRTGARVLVTAGGVPVPFVEKMQIQRITSNRNRPILDTVDTARDLPLVNVIPTSPCAPFQYHREYGTVSNPIQLLPGSYRVTATAVINGKRKSLTVGFDVSTCDFNPTIVVNF